MLVQFQTISYTKAGCCTLKKNDSLLFCISTVVSDELTNRAAQKFTASLLPNRMHSSRLVFANGLTISITQVSPPVTFQDSSTLLNLLYWEKKKKVKTKQTTKKQSHHGFQCLVFAWPKNPQAEHNSFSSSHSPSPISSVV